MEKPNNGNWIPEEREKQRIKVRRGFEQSFADQQYYMNILFFNLTNLNAPCNEEKPENLQLLVTRAFVCVWVCGSQVRNEDIFHVS